MPAENFDERTLPPQPHTTISKPEDDLPTMGLIDCGTTRLFSRREEHAEDRRSYSSRNKL